MDAGAPAPKLIQVSFQYYYVEPGSCPSSDVRVGCGFGAAMTQERLAAVSALYPGCRIGPDGQGVSINCLKDCAISSVYCASQGVYRQRVQCSPVLNAPANACSWTPPD